MTATFTAHPEMRAGLDGPMDHDRQWFHQNQEAVIRFRPLLPDELEVQTAMGQMLGTHGPPAIGVMGADGPLPLTHAVVIDLLRLARSPHGPDGSSGRMRLCCPDPATPELQDMLAMEALRLVLRVMPGRAKHRRGGLGFG